MKATTNYFSRYLGNLRCYSMHRQSGDVLRTDAPKDNRGEGQHFSPTDLVATALGNCMMTIIGIKARDEMIDVEGMEAEVTKTMGTNPRRISRIDIRIQMPSKKYDEKQRKLIERVAKHCPVGRSLHPDLEEVIEFVWPD